MSAQSAKQILSIQSSVVFGYVGNRAATFPLQLLGHQVSCLNTVQFSTHTGYPGAPHGLRLTSEQIVELYEGLTAHGINNWHGLLTGYVPGSEGVNAISKIAKDVKTHTDGNVIWVLDPVMGDEERGLYVSPVIPPLYRTLIAQADIITPNQFELSQLTQLEIVTMQQLSLGLEKVHEMGAQQVVVTTFRDPDEPDVIKVIGSSIDGSNAMTQFVVKVPYYSRPYQGTGDLFAALLLAAMLAQHPEAGTLQRAVLTALNQMRPVLERTGAAFDRELGSDTDWRTEKAEGRGARVGRACELRIVESAKDILDPVPFYSAQPL